MTTTDPERGRQQIVETIAHAPDPVLRRHVPRCTALRSALALARATPLDEAAFHAMLRRELSGCNDGDQDQARDDLRDFWEERMGGAPYTRARAIVALEYAIDPCAMDTTDATERGVDDSDGETRRWRRRVARTERALYAAAQDNAARAAAREHAA